MRKKSTYQPNLRMGVEVRGVELEWHVVDILLIHDSSRIGNL